MTALHWTHGDTALQAEIEAHLSNGTAECLHDNPRRIVYRMHCAGGLVLVKQFRVGSGRHALREGFKARFGHAPAEREWGMLVAMRAAGVPVPEPLALGALDDGDRLLAMRWIDGAPFETALGGAPAARRARLAEAAALIRRVHEVGVVHGDLHLGNLLAGAAGPVLLDWQHARATRDARRRRADLARLEFSLAPLVSRGRRLRVRRIVLGVSGRSTPRREPRCVQPARPRTHAPARMPVRAPRARAEQDGSRRSSGSRGLAARFRLATGGCVRTGCGCANSKRTCCSRFLAHISTRSRSATRGC